MNLKKKLMVGLLTVTLLAPSITSASAESNAFGGWVEGEGYWSKNENHDAGINSRPDSHQGWKWQLYIIC